MKFTDEQQAHIDKLIKEKLDKRDAKHSAAIEKLTASFDADKKSAVSAAEAAILKKYANADDAQKQLAERNDTLQAEIDALKASQADWQTQIDALTAERDAHGGVLQKQLDTRLEKAPDYVKAALNGKGIGETIAYLDEHETKWVKQPANPGGTPAPEGGSESLDDMLAATNQANTERGNKKWQL